MKCVVATIIRNDVAGGFCAATFFFKLEWNIGDGNEGELLEFDFGVSEEELEMTGKALHVANEAARGIQLFDLFRDVVLGP